MAEIPMRGPLDDSGPLSLKSADDSLQIVAEPMQAVSQLLATPASVAALCDLLQLDATPGQAQQRDGRMFLPLSPNQWLVVGDGDGGTQAEVLRESVRGVAHVTDQSHGRCCFLVRGPRARDVLAKGCRLDLHPSVVAPGFCAQTTMAQVGVLLHLRDARPSFALLVPSGFARAFWQWLGEAAGEFLPHDRSNHAT